MKDLVYAEQDRWKFQNGNWTIRGTSDGRNVASCDQAILAVLMDIRDRLGPKKTELQRKPKKPGSRRAAR